MRRRLNYGFRCKMCNEFRKELFNCEIKWVRQVAGEQFELPVIVNAAFCIRCMRRLGIIEKPKGGE